MKPTTIAVLGGPALDWIAHVPAFPPPDGNAVATALELSPGGVGANVAVALARLGHRVRFLAAVGNDDAGRTVRTALENAGVETAYLRIRTDRPTWSCFIAVNPQGERLIFGLPGAALLENAAELPLDAIATAQALHVGPAYRDLALPAIAVARAAGIPVTCAPADVRWPENPAAVLEIAAAADGLIVNRIEAAALTGNADPQTALHNLQHRLPGWIVLTLGAAGALVSHHAIVTHLPSFPVAAGTNSTGAGDAFTAGMIAGLIRGDAPLAAARLGTAVAALKLRAEGAQAGLPSLEEALTLSRTPASGDSGGIS